MAYPYHCLPLRLSKFILLTLILTITSGCRPGSPTYTIPSINFELPVEHTFAISLDHGSLEMVGHNHSHISISGSSPDPTLEIGVISSKDELTTRLQLVRLSNVELSNTVLKVYIPHGTLIDVVQGTGAVFVHDFEGQIHIESVSAPIRIDQVRGSIYANSRRGMIQVSDSDGEIHVLAEADEIRLTDLRGQITGTNIMGAITFEGIITEGDSARLENDHGAVNVDLEQGSDAQISITSAGGRIVCTLPDMSSMFGNCEGKFGIGAGDLSIRTVSGAIRIDQTP